MHERDAATRAPFSGEASGGNVQDVLVRCVAGEADGIVAGRVVGVCGLNMDPYTDQQNVGRVRHLYVLAADRRLGIARRLVTEVIETARGRFEILRLSTTNPIAASCYERLGFRRSDDTAHCTHVMALR